MRLDSVYLTITLLAKDMLGSCCESAHLINVLLYL